MNIETFVIWLVGYIIAFLISSSIYFVINHRILVEDLIMVSLISLFSWAWVFILIMFIVFVKIIDIIEFIAPSGFFKREVFKRKNKEIVVK